MPRYLPFRIVFSGAVLAAGLLALAGCARKEPFADSDRTTLREGIMRGEARTVTVDDLFQAHNWAFEGQGGEQIVVQVVSSGEADPRFAVYSPSYAVVAEDDDSGGTPNAVAVVDLPESGTYIIRVMFWAPGEYTISVD